jgi:2-polyprenyl-3-methyl-5-hydroxy-6-metoxy-1,4-benzoquinol methylase
MRSGSMKRERWNEKWEERLSDGRHAETTGRPNRVLVAAVEGLPPGRALDLACGAGRNAVWLAEQGWSVTGVDFSAVGLAAARRLAREHGAEVQWIEADVLEWMPAVEAFELVLVLYLQLPAMERRLVLERAASAVTPGGMLLVLGHDSSNLIEGYGGPKNPDVLFTAEEVAAQLQALQVKRAERVERPVATDEGERIALDALVLAQRPIA